MMALTYVQAWTQEHQNLAFFFILCSCLIQGCLHMLMPMLMRVLASLVRTGLTVQCTWMIPHLFYLLSILKVSFHPKQQVCGYSHLSLIPTIFLMWLCQWLMLVPGTNTIQINLGFWETAHLPLVGGNFFWQPATFDNPGWMIILVACSRVPKFSLPLPLLTPATQANVLDVTHATLTLVDVHCRMIWLLLLLLTGFQHQSRPWHGFQTHFSPGKCIVLNHDVFDLIFNIIYVIWSDQLKCSSK